MKIRLGILSLLIGYVNSLKFYPFSHSFSSNNPICHNGDLLDKSIHEGCNTIQNNHNLKYSLIGLDTDIEHIKSELGKKFVINLSSLLPKVDTIGHDVLQANNRFIVDVLSYPNVPDDVKKQIILLSIKMAQYGDDLGSVFLQQYYDLVDRFL